MGHRVLLWVATYLGWDGALRRPRW
jgi:hypothetical protein